MITVEVTGGAAIAKALADLEKKVRTKCLAEAERAGSAIVVPAMRSAVPTETGTAKKAVGVKHVRYRAGSVAMGIIGFRSGFKKIISRTFSKRGKQRIKGKRTKLTRKEAPQAEIRDPFFYGHLTVTGRKAVKSGKLMPIRLRSGQLVFGRKAKAVAPSQWMRAVLDGTRAAVNAAMVASLRNSLGL